MTFQPYAFVHDDDVAGITTGDDKIVFFFFATLRTRDRRKYFHRSAISLPSAKVIRTGWRVRACWSRSTMVTPSRVRDRSCERHRAYITFFENSRAPSCAEYSGLTHAYSFGTCLVLPPRVCLSKLLFLLGDRLNARHRIYLGPHHTYVNVYAQPEIRPHRSRARILLCWFSFGRRANARCVQILWRNIVVA